tara:strand:- start:5145 stop:5519 length:375 start_codon:yes stop_codon:yes gene_type:complete
MKYYLQALKNYSNFKGRARRKEYWMFTLIFTLILIFATIIDNLVGTTFEIAGFDLGYGWVYLIVGLLNLLPSLSLIVRRLHDVGKSGWFYFIILIPVIGFIWIFILSIKEGDQGNNLYGPDPKV